MVAGVGRGRGWRILKSITPPSPLFRLPATTDSEPLLALSTAAESVRLLQSSDRAAPFPVRYPPSEPTSLLSSVFIFAIVRLLSQPSVAHLAFGRSLSFGIKEIPPQPPRKTRMSFQEEEIITSRYLPLPLANRAATSHQRKILSGYPLPESLHYTGVPPPPWCQRPIYSISLRSPLELDLAASVVQKI